MLQQIGKRTDLEIMAVNEEEVFVRTQLAECEEILNSITNDLKKIEGEIDSFEIIPKTTKNEPLVRIRTITAFISVSRDSNLRKKELLEASTFLEKAKLEFCSKLIAKH